LDLDFRVGAGQLRAHIMKICEIHFADATTDAISFEVFRHLKELLNSLTVLHACIFGPVFIPPAHENLIRGRSGSKGNRIFVNPEKFSGCRSYYGPRLTLSDAHSQSIGQDPRDNDIPDPRNLLQLAGDQDEVGLQDTRLRNRTANEGHDLVG